MAFVLVVRMRVREGEEENAIVLMRELAAQTRQEPGNELYIPCRDPKDPRSFIFFEQYADKAACMAECKTFKVNKADSYSIADTDTDDFGCRMYHLSVAATDAMSATTHCGHIKAASMSPV